MPGCPNRLNNLIASLILFLISINKTSYWILFYHDLIVNKTSYRILFYHDLILIMLLKTNLNYPNS